MVKPKTKSRHAGSVPAFCYFEGWKCLRQGILVKIKKGQRRGFSAEVLEFDKTEGTKERKIAIGNDAERLFLKEKNLTIFLLGDKLS